MPDAAPRSCSVAAALGVIGEKWSLLVIRELAWGVHRFDAIARNTGAPRDILTSRLRRLEDAGVLERRRYQERPERFEYHLTRAGHELRPVLLSNADILVQLSFASDGQAPCEDTIVKLVNNVGGMKGG